MEDSALSWHWGMAISIKKDGPMRLWTDAAVFINENDIEVLLNQGAHPTKVHFRKPSLGKGAITVGSEHDGVICYLTLVQFNASDNGLIEDSHAILCKVGSLNLLLRSAEASLQLYAFRVAQDTNVSTRDSEAPSGIRSCEVINNHREGCETKESYHAILNRDYFIDRNIDMERLDVVKFRIFAGAVPMIKEIIVLVDDRACDKQHYDILSTVEHERLWLEDFKNMEIPVSADMVLRTENMDLQYRVLCCLPYSQGIVRSDTLLSVVTGSESEATKEPSFYHESAPSNDVSFDSCMLDGILVRKISLKAITLKKCGRTPLSHSEGPVNVYASWQLVADLGLPDLAYVLLFSPSGVARVVCLRAIHNSKPLDRTIFVPPDLSHNIGLNPDQSSPVELGLCDSIPKFPIASRIRLAASYLDEKICQLLLKRYFTRTKKYLVLNDVVCMPLRPSSIFQIGSPLDLDLESASTLLESVALFSVMELEFPGEIHPLFSNGAFVVPTMTQIELQLNAAPKMPEYSLSYFLGSEPLHKLRDEHALRQPFDVLRDVLMSYYSRDLSLNTSPCSIFLVSPNPIALESWVYICADMLGLHIEQPDLAETLDRRENIKDVILGAFERALSRTPSILFLPDVEMLQPTGDSEDQIVHIVKTIMTSMRSCLSSDTSTPVFIAGSYSIAALQPDIESMFLHVVIENIPTIAQSSSFLSNVMRLYSVPSMANIDSASKKLAGSSYDILKKTFVCALKEARRRSVPCFIRKQNDQNAFDLSLRHVQPVLIDIDFEIAIGSSRKMGLSRFTSGVGMQKVSWDDVGGMSLAKKMVIEIITLPLEYYDLMPKNLKRGPGILLYGPPGTGKTFLARAIASNLGLNFLAIKGPELVSAYVGESESNIREVFAAARESSPCLLFFDEIDSISKERGMGRSSGFVNDRLVAQLLAEFDTISSDNSRYHDQHVFIIGATNRPDMLDPALLRSGRLDRMVYLGPCESQEEVISVLKALTRRYTILISDNLLHPASLNPVFTQRRFLLHTSLNLDQIAQHIPLPITNADLYGICSQAHLNATRRVIEALNTHESENYREEKINIPDIIVTSEDFLSTIALYRPSVDTSLFSYYRELHKTLETTNM